VVYTATDFSPIITDSLYLSASAVW